MSQQNYSSDDLEYNFSRYYVKILIYALVAIFFYYAGSFLLVFVRNVNGDLSSEQAPLYEISFKLAFENFPQLVKNIFDSVFGYFSRYANLTKQDTRFLIPFDIGFKLLTIGYFMIFWIPWDTKRCFKKGYFDFSYPFLAEEIKEKLIPEKPVWEASGSSSKLAQINTVPATQNAQTTENLQEVVVGVPDYYKQNPYLRAQLLKNQTGFVNVSQSQNKVLPAQSSISATQFDDDEDDDDDGVLPFDGIHKPLEELYQKYEKYIYSFIRRQILPGSNILLVGYFSTLFIVDLGNPLSVVGYVLGVMSMFWCMQSFLMILDHSQFPPHKS